MEVNRVHMQEHHGLSDVNINIGINIRVDSGITTWHYDNAPIFAMGCHRHEGMDTLLAPDKYCSMDMYMDIGISISILIDIRVLYWRCRRHWDWLRSIGTVRHGCRHCADTCASWIDIHITK
jgi:hypothetical protein